MANVKIGAVVGVIVLIIGIVWFSTSLMPAETSKNNNDFMQSKTTFKDSAGYMPSELQNSSNRVSLDSCVKYLDEAKAEIKEFDGDLVRWCSEFSVYVLENYN